MYTTLRTQPNEGLLFEHCSSSSTVEPERASSSAGLDCPANSLSSWMFASSSSAIVLSSWVSKYLAGVSTPKNIISTSGTSTKSGVVQARQIRSSLNLDILAVVNHQNAGMF
ncbi:hypothetical protein R1flu_027558 [Riccia fluitans]|uniref:Uncharacterized protein n=1 Tax=Riccia fluitans TaxID=41844 RepID=A0ABD1XJ85_9MARC